MKYVFDPFSKHDLVLGGKSLVENHRGLTFIVVGHQVCTHLRRDFVPLTFTDPLQVIEILRLTFGNSNLQLPPQIFCGIMVWRLARPLQDLKVLLLEPLLCCPGRVLGHCHAGILIHDPFLMPWPWRHITPSLIPLMRCSCPVPLENPKILPCSSGLIPHRSHDHWNSTRWDLSWSPSPREIDSYFVFLASAKNQGSNLLITFIYFLFHLNTAVHSLINFE